VLICRMIFGDALQREEKNASYEKEILIHVKGD
jgi:hypothetical protein